MPDTDEIDCGLSVHDWPTPKESDHKKVSNGKYHQGRIENGRENDDLPTKVVSIQGGNGSLNPTWVEWLMGYPSGWTDLKDSVTASSLKSPMKY
jgi:DNA (cytosine-5)-methyltransferase 1